MEFLVMDMDGWLICDEFSLAYVIYIYKLGMSGRRVCFNRGICARLFIEEKTGKEEVQMNF
jgi:hypothetical protein